MYALHVVVAEASNARIYQSGSSPDSLVLIETLGSPAARSHEQALVSSRPGRMVNSGLGRGVSLGTRHSARELELDRFARRIARRVGALGTESPGSGLVLIASARFLGLIERHLSAPSAARVVATLAKDLFQTDRTDLQVRVAQLMRTARPPFARRADVGSTTQAIRHR